MVTIENYEQFAIDFLENSLSESDQLAFEQFLQENPSIGQELATLELHCLCPLKNEVFTKKHLLTKGGARIFPLIFSSNSLIITSVAACILAALLFSTPLASHYFFSNSETNNTPLSFEDIPSESFADAILAQCNQEDESREMEHTAKQENKSEGFQKNAPFAKSLLAETPSTATGSKSESTSDRVLRSNSNAAAYSNRAVPSHQSLAQTESKTPGIEKLIQKSENSSFGEIDRDQSVSQPQQPSGAKSQVPLLATISSSNISPAELAAPPISPDRDALVVSSSELKNYYYFKPEKEKPNPKQLFSRVKSELFSSVSIDKEDRNDIGEDSPTFAQRVLKNIFANN